jgi:plastocyanin
MKTSLALAAALLFATSSANAAAPASAKYSIQLYSYGFQPGPIVLRGGQPVMLSFVNAAGKSHEFKSPAFFRSAKIVAGSVSAEGSVELKPHQTKTVTLIPARGTYEAHCGHFMHTQLGMTTTVEVR